MSVELSSLQIILDGIPDRARVKRLIASWEAEALDQQTICWSQQKVIDLEKKLDLHVSKHSATMDTAKKSKLLTSKQACDYLHMGTTRFIDYKNADMIRIDGYSGNKHLFSQEQLDNFLRIPSHQRNMRLAEALANAQPKGSRRGRKQKPDDEGQVHTPWHSE